MRNILITGATGFIGRHLLARLLESGRDRVFCLVRDASRAKLLEKKGAQLVRGDITDKTSLEALLRYPIDTIFHCAAHVSDTNQRSLYAHNALGTHNVCEVGLRLRVKDFIYLSSVAVVSGNDKTYLDEDMPLCASNAYGQSKIEAERIAQLYRAQGLGLVILRPPMVYGEDEPHLMLSMLKLIAHRLFPLIGKARNLLHLAYVENVVAAMLYCLGRDEFKTGTFFVADQEILSVAEIMNIFVQVIKAPSPIHLPEWLAHCVRTIPYVGRYMNFYLKDRVYNLRRINALGFVSPYPVRISLVKSAKELYFAKQ